MNRIDLEGRVVAITGGARGIGYAVAQRALNSGASVALWDVDADRLARSQRELSELGKVTAVTVELTQEAAVAQAVAQTVADHGAIDVLINCAGITGGNGATWELEPDVWRRVIDVKELATKNILVNAVTPAAAKTEIFDSMSQQHIDYMLSKIPMNRFLLPEEAASLILWLSSEDCAFSTGSVFDLSGGRATY
jgi:NAD(P)-dependent dehydrogenase (short-subunit alcohol dehydrogenase family)